MAQRKNDRNTRGTQTGYRRTAYLEGSAVKQLREAYDIEKVPERKHLSKAAQKNREKAFRMNLGYVLFLSVALTFTVMTLCSYLELQSEITNAVDKISELETEYNNLKLTNDEEYNRINSSIDLEEIKAIAIGDLGMSYAKEGQIVNVENAETDYVRQMDELN